MTQKQARQRQQDALRLARNIQSRGLLERMAQKAVNRANNAELAKAQKRAQKHIGE